MLVNAMMRHVDRQGGFTLIELMVTIFVLSILLAIAVPSFRGVIHRSDVSSGSNALLADISYARTEAINRGTYASICPSADGSSCSSDGATFDKGWIVYTYAPGSAVPGKAYDSTKDTTNLLLRVAGTQGSVSIQSDNSDVLSFGPQGQTVPASSSSSASSTFDFMVCFRQKDAGGHGTSTTEVPGTELTVNPSGSVTTKSMGVSSDCAY